MFWGCGSLLRKSGNDAGGFGKVTKFIRQEWTTMELSVVVRVPLLPLYGTTTLLGITQVFGDSLVASAYTISPGGNIAGIRIVLCGGITVGKGIAPSFFERVGILHEVTASCFGKELSVRLAFIPVNGIA